MTDGISKAIATVKRVAKQIPRVAGDVLPAAVIIKNVADAHSASGGNLSKGIGFFTKRMTGIAGDGQFYPAEFMLGTGSLLIAGAARWLLKQIA